MTKLEIRFWTYVDRRSNEECWEWKGYKNQKGYGRISGGCKKFSAHRLAWEFHYKQKVPEGMQILHHCDNPGCVNHWHLYCGTNAENRKDMVDRDRAGFRQALFTSEEVKRIKQIRLKMTIPEVAKLLEIGTSTVSRICNSEKRRCKDGLYA